MSSEKTSTVYLFREGDKWKYESAEYGVERKNSDNYVGGESFNSMTEALDAASKDDKVRKPFVGAVDSGEYNDARRAAKPAVEVNPNMPSGSSAGSVDTAASSYSSPADDTQN